jgi:hypothetical protein
MITRGRPGRDPSDSPSNRSTRNRPRHFDTVARDTPRPLDTDALLAPSCAHASTILALNANACAVVRRRTPRPAPTAPRRYPVAGLDRATEVSGRGRLLRVWALDETGQEKRGQATAGFKRQHLGCAGGVDNGISTVHLA